MKLGLCYSSSTLIPPRVKMKLGLCYSSSVLIPPRVNDAWFVLQQLYSNSTACENEAWFVLQQLRSNSTACEWSSVSVTAALLQFHRVWMKVGYSYWANKLPSFSQLDCTAEAAPIPVRATASLSHSKSSVVASPIPAVQIQPRPAT